ncbi:PREDICTED: uncharacterized protein LOC105121995 [Populus euphratica]|uniref:Uncharacterized protein LOC105121995 n=1 Tax=Populus euphratica TaxID=75702 RepID=A0AAJ6TY70_POPEU|nr:PREDICTED: uncharacterized protein LOC105121995 [Populus euphratica]
MEGSKMSSDVKSSRTYSEPSSERGFGLELKKSSRWQQHWDTALPTQAMQSLKHQDKLKAKYYGSQRCVDMPRELKLHANDRILVQPKTSGNSHQLHSVKRNSIKDDELVKYMSDLPGFLQRMERSESIQDKALNVGVLDWSRLENWRIAASYSNSTSLTSSNLPSKITMKSAAFPNAVHNNTLAHRSKQHPSLSSSLNSSHKDHVSRASKPPIQNALCFQDFETSSKSSVNGQKKVRRTNKSVGRNNSDVILEQGKRKDVNQKITSKVRSRSSNSRYDSISIRSKVNMSACDSAAEKRAGEKEGLEVKRKPLDQTISSRIRTPSSQMRSHDVSPSSKAKNVADGKTKKGIEELQESSIDLSPQHQSMENNIVLLVPKKLSTNCSPQEPRTLLDKDLNETHRRSLSDVFSHVEVQSSEILHSCSLISRKETDTEPHKLLHAAMVMRGAETSADASCASACSRKMPIRLSEDKFAGESSGRAAKGSVIETSNTLDQETMEVMARKGRHPSPNHRFSFSLSRMSRSFSFKESSAVPQLSSTYISTKSGPVISGGSACLDNSNREKASGHNRARSSPLRRMLDPLLKSRSSRTLISAENDSLKDSLNSFNLKRFDATEPLKDEKHEPPRIKAHLQLSMRNGVPLFRFAVGNNSNFLAANMNKLSSPQKNDSGCDYTFYTVDEIKRKSGSWINQGSKEKSCGYIYNVIGCMRVNNSSSISALTGPSSICQIKVKESVLFIRDPSQADQASPRFMENTELAAVVVKMLNEIPSLDLQQTDQNENLGKTEHSNSVTTVILPGGNHSLPNEGVPSPLIHRWRSGGSCDCGGWDVGCKLRILSNGSQCSEVPRTSKSCLMPDCLELFNEGANQQDQPLFSLAQVEKGMYSIEFSSSISSLQAFFIGVTVISCQKSTDLLDVSNASGEKFQQEPRNSSDVTKKIHTMPPGKTHVKYTLSPPLSPFERV